MKYNINQLVTINTSKVIVFAVAIIVTMIPNDALAATSGALGNLDLQSIMVNLRTIIKPLTQLVLAVSFVAGIAFMFHGVIMLHTFGQIQNQMSKPHGITGPFVQIAIGAILLYLPSSLTTLSNTLIGVIPYNFFNPSESYTFRLDNEGNAVEVTNELNYATNASSELGYGTLGMGNEWAQLIDTIVQFIQLVGLISFIRGWFILSQAGGSGAQQGSFGKGIVHIIGGILAINFIPFMHAIAQIIF